MTYAARLSEIAENVFDYLSRQDAISNGMILASEALPEPDILPIYYQMLAHPGSLPKAGGLLDQPWALMHELSACRDGCNRYSRVSNMPKPSDAMEATPDTEAARMEVILALPGL